MMDRIDMRALYAQKIIVMLEVRPCSDQFEQVMLTEGQFNFLSAGLYRMFPICKSCKGATVVTNEKQAAVFKDVPMYYDPPQISGAADEDTHTGHLH